MCGLEGISDDHCGQEETERDTAQLVHRVSERLKSAQYFKAKINK